MKEGRAASRGTHTPASSSATCSIQQAKTRLKINSESASSIGSSPGEMLPRSLVPFPVLWGKIVLTLVWARALRLFYRKIQAISSKDPGHWHPAWTRLLQCWRRKGRILQAKTFLLLSSWEVSKLCDGSYIRRINAVEKHIRQPEQISLCQKDPPYGSFSLNCIY